MAQVEAEADFPEEDSVVTEEAVEAEEEDSEEEEEEDSTLIQKTEQKELEVFSNLKEKE